MSNSNIGNMDVKNLNVTEDIIIGGTLFGGGVINATDLYTLSSLITTANQSTAFTDNVPSQYQNNIYRVDTTDFVTLVLPSITETATMISITDSTGNASIKLITIKPAVGTDTLSGILNSSGTPFQINGDRNTITIVSDFELKNWIFV